ncbi:MAG TPA: SDR family oxidoreductase [Acetobacteraceae bacterium]|nr:SDR family oxidoreductase [Acetobacteraceae bacterium]
MAGTRVLVTGIDGYIGSVLGAYLLEKGFDVTGIDCGFYRDGWLYNDPRPRPLTLTKDIRRITQRDLEGFAAVVHLAELSNDPLGELNERTTYDINHGGSVSLAKACKEAGVSRFVYTSSCSVYGAAEDGLDCTELSRPNPQTAYAKCKVLVEQEVGSLADSRFSPVFLRNATAFGRSPRMRFDIVLNNLAGLAWTTRQIRMTSDGTPWRPLVHVEDICQAIALALSAPREAIHNEIFNVGDDEQNYRIGEIATIIGQVFDNCTVSLGRSNGDNRSYRTSFGKIRRHLPEFQCKWSAKLGAQQLRECFEQVQMTDDMFSFRAFTRLRQLTHLISTQQIDSDFYWRHVDQGNGTKLSRPL